MRDELDQDGYPVDFRDSDYEADRNENIWFARITGVMVTVGILGLLIAQCSN